MKEQNYLLDADKQKFHYLSHHDSLTNLPNRSYFNHHLQILMDSTNTNFHFLTLYFMDLDGFKQINDHYGHNIGDIILLQSSKRLQSCFREKDFVARLGGDEFTAVIIHHLNDKISEELAIRIEQEFMSPFIINNLEIKCPISLGKATYPLDGVHPETLLKIADDAMYKHKKLKATANIKNL
jgi:diguanylate cyclase (GGDEF)-like protein